MLIIYALRPYDGHPFSLSIYDIMIYDVRGIFCMLHVDLTQSLDISENESNDISNMIFQDCINGHGNRDGNDNITENQISMVNSQVSRVSINSFIYYQLRN